MGLIIFIFGFFILLINCWILYNGDFKAEYQLQLVGIATILFSVIVMSLTTLLSMDFEK